MALKITLLFLILAYPAARFAHSFKPLATPLTWVGGFWLAAMVYALFGFAVVDLFRLSDRLFHWFPALITANRVRTGQMFLAGGGGILLLALIVGRLIALSPAVREVELKIDRLPPEREGYRVALLSDAHLGTLVSKKFLDRLTAQVNSLNPDLTLIPGDVFDENLRETPWAVEGLSRFRARDGVIVSTGNHEFYANVKACVDVLQEARLSVLRDEYITIPGTVVVAGLDDITGSRQFGGRPKPIVNVIAGADTTLPLFVMHHTPIRMEEAAAAGADLFVSGHTHGGQLWPFSYVTRMVFKVKSGLTMFGKMNFFLTVGAGTWGPPIRLGATPEVILFRLSRI